MSLLTNPKLADVLAEVQRGVKLWLNCHHLATIQSFDPVKQTATATINYKRSVQTLDTTTGRYSTTLVDYPILSDCPVFYPFGGSGGFTYPLQKGDQCMVAFNDRDMDNWFSGALPGELDSNRLHSFSDALIYVGVRPETDPIKIFDASRPMLRNFDGSARVAIGPALIDISNNSYGLNQLLQELVNDVKTLVTATAAITVICPPGGGPSSVPVNAAAINAAATALTTTATKIAGLLQ
jgi:hypothetical protein